MTNYFIMMYIVFKLREQQKKAVNSYEKSCLSFFRGICNEKLAKLLIRKCCLFIWYQNRPFKIKFEVIFLRVVQFNNHLQKTKINYITHSPEISRQLL